MADQITITVSLPKFGWRVRWILIVFALGWLVTLGIGIYDRAALFGQDSHTLAEVFVAWAGELIFFTVVGLAVTVVSLEKPVLPPDPRTRPMRERIDILFGMADVPDVVRDYARQVLEGMARYASRVERTITVKSHRPDLCAYLVEVEHDYIIQNVLDSEQAERIPLSITPDLFPEDPGLSPGRVISIKVRDVKDTSEAGETIKDSTPIPPKGFIAEPEPSYNLPALGACRVTVKYEVFMRCGCMQTLTANRLVESFKLKFVSQVASNPVVHTPGRTPPELTLRFNQPAGYVRSVNHVPGDKLHHFMFRDPSGIARGGEVMASSLAVGPGSVILDPDPASPISM